MIRLHDNMNIYSEGPISTFSVTSHTAEVLTVLIKPTQRCTRTMFLIIFYKSFKIFIRALHSAVFLCVCEPASVYASKYHSRPDRHRHLIVLTKSNKVVPLL